MEQQKQEGLIGGVLSSLLLAFGTEVVIPFLKKIIENHEAKDSGVVALDGGKEPCPQGYVRNADGKCVRDVG